MAKLQFAPRTMEEQETTIVFDRGHQNMKIYTADTTMMTKLDKIYKRSKEILDHGKLFAVEYVVNKELLSFRSKRVKRTMTEEQKQAARTRMKKIRAAQLVK